MLIKPHPTKEELEIHRLKKELEIHRLKKEWVNLTREEILEAVEQSNSVYIVDMARAIEAKLREKNG